METTAGTQQKFIAEHIHNLGKFMFYTNVLVSEFDEGVHVTKDNASQPIRLVQQIYGSKTPFIYISHRRNSYSMDPIGYGVVVKMFPNLVGFAIVSKNRYRRMLATIEKLFIRRPIGVFHDMEDAFEWADSLLDKAQQDLD